MTTSVRHALAMSAVARIGSSVIVFISVLVLSRVLTPVETGIFSVSAAIITLAHAIRDFGLGSYINQERELTPERVATTLGLALLIGWTIGIVLFAISEPAARWYSEPGVARVLHILALGFFIVPIGAPSLAILYREMRFREIALINLGSTIVQTTTAVAFALAGASYMSLAYGNLFGLLATILGLVLIRAPHLFTRPKLVAWRHVTGFGIFACMSLLIDYAGRIAPDIIIGRFLGIAPVAFLSRARGITDMFQDTMIAVTQPVAFSAFAAGHRDGIDQKEGYLRAMTLYSGVAWPFYTVLAFAAFPTVRLLYGSQWDASVPLLRVLCAAGSMNALCALAGQALYAIGQPQRVMRWQAVAQGTLILVTIFSAQFSLLYVAYGLVASSTVSFFAAQSHLSATLRIRFVDVVRAVIGSAALALICGIQAAVVLDLVGWEHYGAMISIALVGVSSTVIWIVGLLIIRHPLRHELMNALRNVLRRDKPLSPGVGGDAL